MRVLVDHFGLAGRGEQETSLGKTRVVHAWVTFSNLLPLLPQMAGAGFPVPVHVPLEYQHPSLDELVARALWMELHETGCAPTPPGIMLGTTYVKKTTIDNFLLKLLTMYCTECGNTVRFLPHTTAFPLTIT